MDNDNKNWFMDFELSDEEQLEKVDEATKAMHFIYKSFIKAGFTKSEAMTIMMKMMKIGGDNDDE